MISQGISLLPAPPGWAEARGPVDQGTQAVAPSQDKLLPVQVETQGFAWEGSESVPAPSCPRHLMSLSSLVLVAASSRATCASMLNTFSKYMRRVHLSSSGREVSPRMALVA